MVGRGLRKCSVIENKGRKCLYKGVRLLVLNWGWGLKDVIVFGY